MKPYVDKNSGVFLGYWDDNNPTIPKTAILAESNPANGRDSYDLVNKVWKPYEPPYDEKRKQEYNERLGDQGDQNDAIYKGVMAVVDLLKTLGVSDSQLNNAGLLPDKNAAPGTPAHWLGTIDDIKTRNPKPKLTK